MARLRGTARAKLTWIIVALALVVGFVALVHRITRQRELDYAFASAIAQGNYFEARLLAYKGADTNMRVDENRHVPAGDHALIHRILGFLRLRQPSRSVSGESPLAIAVRNPRMELLNDLLINAASPDSRSATGDPVLCLAARNSRFARRLLDAGADPNARNAVGDTPLMVAAREGPTADDEAVPLLLSSGAKVDAVNYQGDTALILACRSLNPTMVRQLVDAGADVNRIGANGITPLMSSPMFLDEPLPGIGPQPLMEDAAVEEVHYLISNRADPKQKSATGETANQIAIRLRHYKVASELNAAETRLAGRNDTSTTPKRDPRQ